MPQHICMRGIILQNKNQLFDTDHLKTGLKERAVKSAGITLAAQAIKLILQLGSIAILARLLQPSDFGLIAMVTVFTGLALQFMEVDFLWRPSSATRLPMLKCRTCFG